MLFLTFSLNAVLAIKNLLRSESKNKSSKKSENKFKVEEKESGKSESENEAKFLTCGGYFQPACCSIQ